MMSLAVSKFLLQFMEMVLQLPQQIRFLETVWARAICTNHFIGTAIFTATSTNCCPKIKNQAKK